MDLKVEFTNYEEFNALLERAGALAIEFQEVMTKLNNFKPEAEITKPEQLYYVKSPLEGYGVLSIYKLTLKLYWTWQITLSSGFQTRFNQAELDKIQEDSPGLNIETLKVRVEDFEID